MNPNTRKIVVLVAAGVVVLAAFMPWVSAWAAFVGTFTKNGIDGDGKITLLLAGAVIVCVLGGRQRLALLPALTLAGVAVYEAIHISERIHTLNARPDVPATGSVGIGVWLTLAGAITVAGLCGLDVLKPPELREGHGT